jgi:hypothetical protein
MKRRTFVHIGVATLGTLPLQGFSTLDFSTPAKPQWIIDLIKLNDQGFDNFFAAQILDTTKMAYGAIKDSEEIPNVQSSGHFIAKAAIALANPESQYYQSADLLKKVGLAAQYLLQAQHADGTIDLTPVGGAPVVTVVIILFNTAELTFRCLRSLAALRGEVPFDVLIIDNASSAICFDQ